jgi:hypothetical protein
VYVCVCLYIYIYDTHTHTPTHTNKIDLKGMFVKHLFRPKNP